MEYPSHYFEGHYIFNAKNQGTVKSLCGDVIVVAFFINDAVSHWNEGEIKDYEEVLWNAFRTVKQDAAANGISVKFRMASCPRDASVDCNRHNRDIWMKEVTNCDTCNGVAEYQAYYKSHYPCDELAVLFIFNKQLRDYAASANKDFPTYGEYAVLSAEPDKRCIIHELLHQFGAKDLYYPDEVRTLAKRYLPDSVMNEGYLTVIDPLTRYLIGWTDKISDGAFHFLCETQHITQEYIDDQLARIWKKEEQE